MNTGKRKVLFLILNVVSITASGQDTLFLRNKKQLVVKVIQVDIYQLKYKKLENLNGPVYIIPNNKIAYIRYVFAQDW